MKGPHVLVVDDDRDFAEMMALVLQGRGCRTDVAFSGEEAILKFEKGDYDIAFMDVRLPGIDGVESFEKIRLVKPGARVVLVTGYSRDQVLERARQRGALGVMGKPPDIDEIQRYLDGLPARRGD